MLVEIVIILSLLVVILLILYLNLRQKYQVLQHSKKSQSSRYGKMTEQFLPFLDDYPYDPGNFRFLGTPIDGVQFEDDKVVLVEFKTAQSQLSTKQKNVRRLVEEGKVEFEEHRLE
ncbi:MAG: Holliday junction resolvase-like protein [Parcubacteria group bacterium]